MITDDRPDTFLPMDVHSDLIEDALINFMAAKGTKKKRKAGEQITKCFPDCWNALEVKRETLKHLRFIHPDLLTTAEFNRVVAVFHMVEKRAGEFMESEIDKYQERVNSIYQSKKTN